MIVVVRQLWFVQQSERKRRKQVRLEQDDNRPKVQVITKVAKRDPKNGGRWVYETYDSFNVLEASAEEVAATVDKAFGRKGNRQATGK
jgi:hypothetical protein